MAEYTFGDSILRYVQNQDELNLRAKQLLSEEQQQKAQLSFQQRQAQLVGARWQADYDLKVAKEYADQENAFSKENTILNALPEDVRSQIPTEAYKYKGENIYVPNEVVTNLEEGNKRALDLQKEKNDELYRVETLKNANDSERLEGGRLSETIRHNKVMESKESGSGSTISPKLYSENITLASDNLTKLKVFHSSGSGSNLKDTDYTKFKGEGIKAVENALSNVGITKATIFGDTGKTVFDYVRGGGDLSNNQKKVYQDKISGSKKGSTEEALARREFLNASIGSISYALLSEQLEAFKLWNEIGTR